MNDRPNQNCTFWGDNFFYFFYMISSKLRPALRTLFSGGRSTQIAAYRMTSPAAAIAYVKSNGGKRIAETPLRSEEESRGSYKFKNKRMRKGHGGAQNQ